MGPKNLFIVTDCSLITEFYCITGFGFNLSLERLEVLLGLRQPRVGLGPSLGLGSEFEPDFRLEVNKLKARA